MSAFVVTRFFAAFFGVLGALLLGFWYLYYRRISPKLPQEHVPRATRRYVRGHFVLLGLESTLLCLGFAAGWYAFPLISVPGSGSQVWLIAGLAGFAVAALAMFAVIVTGGQLRQALRSVEQSGPDSIR